MALKLNEVAAPNVADSTLGGRSGPQYSVHIVLWAVFYVIFFRICWLCSWGSHWNQAKPHPELEMFSTHDKQPFPRYSFRLSKFEDPHEHSLIHRSLI